MRYLTIIVLLFICAFSAQAQNDLLFDDVVLIELAPTQDSSFTVPAGKVWKIEQGGGAHPSSSYYIYLRNASGENIGLIEYNQDGIEDTPAWLPSGFTGSFYNNSNYKGFVSILQFHKGQ